MKTITVWNMKGGVGKTTLAFNIAAELAHGQKRVLCLDLDPQGNLLSFFEKHRSGRGKESIREIAEGDFDRLEKAIYRCSHGPDYIRSDNRPVIPQTIRALFLALQRLQTAYDYILIDCPPAYDAAVQSAIYAADLVLVPIVLDAFSRDNLNLVYNDIQLTAEKKDLNDGDPDAGEPVDIAWAALANRVAARKSQQKVLSDLTAKHDYPIMDICISDTAAFSSANLLHKPITAHRSRSAAAEDLRTLCSILEREVEESCRD